MWIMILLPQQKLIITAATTTNTHTYIWTYIQKISVYNNTTKTGKFGFKFQGLLVDIHFSKKQISHLDNIRASLQKQSSSNNNNNNIGITSELHAKVHGISE